MSGIAGLCGTLTVLLITSCLLMFQALDAFGQAIVFPRKEWEETTSETLNAKLGTMSR